MRTTGLKEETMQKLALAAVTAATLGAVVLTGCSTDDDDRCNTPSVLYYNTVTHHYYTDPGFKSKPVPAYKVPSAARKVPGYKPVGPKTPPKVNTTKPGSKVGSGSGGGYKAPKTSSGSGFRSGRR